MKRAYNFIHDHMIQLVCESHERVLNGSQLIHGISQRVLKSSWCHTEELGLQVVYGLLNLRAIDANWEFLQECHVTLDQIGRVRHYARVGGLDHVMHSLN